METIDMSVIHYMPYAGMPYAPCGARIKSAHLTARFFVTRTPRVTCENCKRTRAYMRGQILDLPRGTVTFIKVSPVERYDYGTIDGRFQRITLGYDLPEPGGRWSYSEWEQSSAQEATHVLINPTGYSDYSGDAVDVSNHRSLLRDYPDTFTDTYGDYGTRELMLSVDWTAPDDGRAGLLDDIARLADYALYDEEDYSRLEMETAWEAWDSYLYLDVPSDLAKRSESSEAMEDAIEALDALAKRHGAEYPSTVCQCGYTARNWDEMISHLEQYRSLRDMFYESDADMASSPYMESTTSVVFPYYDDMLSVMAEQIWRLRCDDQPTMPGWHNTNQGTLDLTYDGKAAK